LVHDCDSLLTAKDRAHAIDILERLYRGGIQTHRAFGDKARDAFVADAVDHASQGTICLWRLAAHVASPAQTASVRRRFHRFFQFVRLDCACEAPIVADLLGLNGRDCQESNLVCGAGLSITL
jgi:hypothetical protein